MWGQKNFFIAAWFSMPTSLPSFATLPSETFNFCTVPTRGYDAFLFASTALICAAILFGKLSAVWALLAGSVLGVANYFINMRELSNAASLWLSIYPADLFLYAFLPPLIVEQAIRADFFMLRRTWLHTLLLAFIMVLLTTLALTPIILFVLGFRHRGWSWVHGALFSAIISPTDALAVAAVLARANAPAKILAVVEGEALFNDATGITLYAIFSKILFSYAEESRPDWPSVWSVIPTILEDTARLTAIGIGIGIAFSWATERVLRWLRWRGARPYIETSIVLAVAYLAYYVANAPAGGSGVIAVVVFGLYGNATSRWGMLATAEQSGAFDAVWDVISFVANGLVFFWSGLASVNFLIRSVKLLNRTAASYYAIPCIFVAMIIIRTTCIALFNPLFRALGEGLAPREIVFVGWAGMRGAVSLIMVSAFASGSRPMFEEGQGSSAAAVSADISLWTAAFVVLTLLINGPSIAHMLRLLGLDSVPPEMVKMRSRARRALCRFTKEQLALLKDDDDEFLQSQCHEWDVALDQGCSRLGNCSFVVCFRTLTLPF